jgi:hypothetical protein
MHPYTLNPVQENKGGAAEVAAEVAALIASKENGNGVSEGGAPGLDAVAK